MMKLFNCDCVEGAKKYLDDCSVDLIICDPPFGIHEASFDQHYNRDDSNVITGYQEAPKDYYNFTVRWIEQAKRVLKDDGSLYIISGWSNLRDVLNAIDKNEMFVINHLIWKFNFGVYTKNKFVTSHYHILYIKKNNKVKVTFNRECRYKDGVKNLNGRSIQYADLEDVWLINKEYATGEIKNQNKLPGELVRKMIQYSSNEGDLVCDFFLGNFTTAFEAKKLNRQITGFEINRNAYNYFLPLLEETENEKFQTVFKRGRERYYG